MSFPVICHCLSLFSVGLKFHCGKQILLKDRIITSKISASNFMLTVIYEWTFDTLRSVYSLCHCVAYLWGGNQIHNIPFL